MILEDLVMLGKTHPETDRQGRQTVCSVFFSPELRQPVRVYPLSTKNLPPDFSVCEIKLERNPKDTRHESWKIFGPRGVDVHEEINSRIKVKSILNDKESVLSMIPTVSSIKEANERKLSIAMVEPEGYVKYVLEKNKDIKDAVSSKSYPWIPRLKFKTGTTNHKLKFLNQDVFKNMSKNSHGSVDHILDLISGSPRLLVGNMFAHRNNWLVISAFKKAQ
jgi:hypothetical protein